MSDMVFLKWQIRNRDEALEKLKEIFLGGDCYENEELES